MYPKNRTWNSQDPENKCDGQPYGMVGANESPNSWRPSRPGSYSVIWGAIKDLEMAPTEWLAIIFGNGLESSKFFAFLWVLGEFLLTRAWENSTKRTWIYHARSNPCIDTCRGAASGGYNGHKRGGFIPLPLCSRFPFSYSHGRFLFPLLPFSSSILSAISSSLPSNSSSPPPLSSLPFSPLAFFWLSYSLGWRLSSRCFTEAPSRAGRRLLRARSEGRGGRIQAQILWSSCLGCGQVACLCSGGWKDSSRNRLPVCSSSSDLLLVYVLVCPFILHLFDLSGVTYMVVISFIFFFPSCCSFISFF